MTRKPKNLGDRKHERIEFRKVGFVFLQPDAPWIECIVLDISEGGVRLDVGALPVPDIFGLAFSSKGSVRRLCMTAWRRGELLGARFVTPQQLRDRFPQQRAAAN